MTATTIRAQMAQRKDTAAGWTAANPILLSGEIGYETDTKKFKIGNGSTNWNSLAYLPIPDGSGNLTITGNLEIGTTGSLTFEGSTADGFETTLAVTNPTADRTITLPDVTGTVITSGDTGSVTSTMLADGTIVNADVNANAAIAGTKISPDFGSQAVVTTGTSTAASFIPTSSTVPSNGLYLSGMNTVALATASTGRLFVDASGNVVLAPVTARAQFHVYGTGQTTANLTDAGARGGFLRVSDAGSAAGSGGGLIFSNVQGDGANSIGFAAIKGLLTDGSNNTLGDLAFSTRTTNAATALQERMRLTSDGRLGLGNSAPNSILSVSSGLKATNNNYLFLETTDASNKFQLKTSNVANTAWSIQSEEAGIAYRDLALNPSGGRVGIGTTSPGSLLDVNGTVRAGNYHIFDGSTSAAGAVGFSTSNGPALEFWGSATAGGGSLIANAAGSERARIDSSGRLLVGTSTARSNFFNSTVSSAVHIESLSDSGRFLSLVNSGSGGSGGGLILGSSKSGTLNGNGLVSANGEIGLLSFQGNDGTEFVEAARIEAAVDGTPGTNDMPGRLVFSTTADGASSPTERVRITSGGYFKASNDGNYLSPSSSYHEFKSTVNDTDLYLYSTNGSFSASQLTALVAIAASSSYNFASYVSGFPSSPDTEFILRGDGNAYADGAWTGGGADYAEYFEWNDGNPDAEDRRGISVVLDGDKIRPAVAGEDPIGVISGNPSVVGDAAWNKWSGKYLRDEYGTYILEDYEVEDEDGNTVIQQRRKLNPVYDPDVEYISREERPEWDCVGLMGKLRIRKGQPTGSRWIKMRDISATVEEWLVR